MPYFIGVDFHKSSSYLTVLDEFGQQVKSGRIKNNPEELQHFLAPFKGAQAVLEAGRNWTLMYDWLEEMTARVVLAHPWKVKVIASAKIKTDKIDAGILAHLLRADLIPMAHVPSPEARGARELLRQRMFLVRLSTMVKNRIRTLVDRHPEFPSPPRKNLFREANKEWFGTLALSEAERLLLNQDLTLLNALRERIHESDKAVLFLAKINPQIQLLKTIPGIGIFFATLIVYEVDDVQRFPDAKKFAAYVGLVPSTYSSGGRTFQGRITKQGNKFLRWAFVEAVWPAVKKDEGLRHYYQKLKAKKGANPAKVATARRLLSITYHILKDNRPYENRWSPSYIPSDQE